MFTRLAIQSAIARTGIDEKKTTWFHIHKPLILSFYSYLLLPVCPYILSNLILDFFRLGQDQADLPTFSGVVQP